MNQIREKAVALRKFLPKELVIRSWDDIKSRVDQLKESALHTTEDLHSWLLKRSELEAVIGEEKAWLYIHQSCHTDNESHARAFARFVNEIEEPFSHAIHELNEKLLDFCRSHDYPEEYEIFVRSIRRQTEIFREENVKLQADLEVEEQQYGTLTGAMTISHDDEELTLQQAQNLLKSTNRKIRKEVFEKIWDRRSDDYAALNKLLSSLLEKRQRMAQNAEFDNYLEYRFAQLGRFDYTLADCENFHASVKENIVPLLDELYKLRKNKLGQDTLYAYDLEVDPDNKPPLSPFSNVKDLVEKAIACFSEIDPQFGEFIHIMDRNGYLDLDSRKGKAPGGYNYPLHESNVPFIFMNATHSLRDMETMMHEGGHAIHSFLSKDLELVYYKETPAEIAEVASMAMELISMEHWHHFFSDQEELRRAKISQLEGVLKVLPWVATIDKFQHWLYKNPGHSIQERLSSWKSIAEEFDGSTLSWEGYRNHQLHQWQKQIHIFQFPLYYIEYGIAQLGAIGIWKNYREDRAKTITAYRRALSMGYSVTLPELYETAGIRFDFSADYICELSDFVRTELQESGA